MINFPFPPPELLSTLLLPALWSISGLLAHGLPHRSASEAIGRRWADGSMVRSRHLLFYSLSTRLMVDGLYPSTRRHNSCLLISSHFDGQKLLLPCSLWLKVGNGSLLAYCKPWVPHHFWLVSLGTVYTFVKSPFILNFLITLLECVLFSARTLTNRCEK